MITIVPKATRKPYFNICIVFVQPEEPATATYGIEGGVADPIDAVMPITAAKAPAPIELLAKAMGTATEVTICAVTICEPILDSIVAQETNKAIINSGANPRAKGTMEAETQRITPHFSLAITSPIA